MHKQLYIININIIKILGCHNCQLSNSGSELRETKIISKTIRDDLPFSTIFAKK